MAGGRDAGVSRGQHNNASAHPGAGTGRVVGADGPGSVSAARHAVDNNATATHRVAPD